MSHRNRTLATPEQVKHMEEVHNRVSKLLKQKVADGYYPKPIQKQQKLDPKNQDIIL